MAFAPRCTRRRAKGCLESLLLFYIRRLQSIPLLILPVRVGLDILPIWIGFCTCEVNGRGVPTLEDVNVCPKLVHTSTSCVAFSLWRRPKLRRGSGMLGLTRSFRDWHWCSFCAFRGMPLRGFLCTLLVTEDPTDSMAYGDRENLKSFASILSTNGATQLKLLTVCFSQKPITCAPNIYHRHRSHFQQLFVNSVLPHF